MRIVDCALEKGGGELLLMMSGWMEMGGGWGGCGLVIGGRIGLVEAHTEEKKEEEAMGASEWKMNE